ncbi:MAG: peptidase T [Christensenellales bacterium]|jgi:tripeptide aminopeptidase
MSTVTDLFLDLVQYDTQSCSTSATFPTTPGQKVMAEHIAQTLRQMGLADAHMDEFGYVYASLPSNLDHPAPTVGLIAHMDTAEEISGKDVRARVVRYEGGDVVLNAEQGIVMRAEAFENLANYVGQDLIVTDGTTLLGADDKAGVAEIMAIAQRLVEHPEIPHGAVKIAFTPDEEVGGGVDHFDVAAFGADFAYTLDGGAPGSVDYESFNACTATVDVFGVSIHPGGAKGKMKNASLMAMEFHSMLPVNENPAYTEGYDGFSHLTKMSGEVERAQMQYIIRDHDRTLFEQRKARFTKIADYLNDKYGAGTIALGLVDTYYNMKEMIAPHPEIIQAAQAAMRAVGLEPVSHAIRGGTDGSRLSFMGLPCPNLCAGGENGHGRYEFTSIQSLEKIVDILEQLLRVIAG